MNALASIRTHIDQTRKRFRLHRALLTAATGLGGMAMLLVLFLLLDNTFRGGSVLPRIFLVALLLSLLGIIVAIIRNHRRSLGDDFMARLMERTLAERDNRLINAVQLARDPRKTRVAETILEEHPPPLQNLRDARLFPKELIRNIIVFLLASLLAAIALFSVMPQRSAHSLVRLFSPITPPPTYSRTRIVSVSPGNAQVPRGENISVKTEFDGILPKRAFIEWHRQDETTHRIAMVPQSGTKRNESAPAPTVFEAELPPIFTGLRYRVLAGDAVSRWYAIDMLVAPVLESWKANITPPEHTGIPLFSLDPDQTDRSIPAQSTIRLLATTTIPITQQKILLGSTVLAETHLQTPETTTAIEFDAPARPGAFRVELTAENGMNATETLPLTIKPDTPPVVRWTNEERILTAAPDSVLNLPFDAKDDYGLTTVRLTRVAEESGQVETITEQPPDPDKTKPQPRSEGAFSLAVSKLNLVPGESVLLQARALDNANPAQHGTSNLIRLEITNPERLQAEKERKKKAFEDALATLIERQRINYQNTSKLRDSAIARQGVGQAATRNARNIQAAILVTTGNLLRSEFKIGGLRDVLLSLADNEMPAAIATFDAVLAAFDDMDKTRRGLVAETELQQRILAALTTMAANLDSELAHQRKVDIIQRLRDMIEAQDTNLRGTRKISGTPNPQTRPLVKAQDALALRCNSFMDDGRDIRDNTDDDAFARNLSAVMTLFQERQLYITLITAAETLEEKEIQESVTSQSTALDIMKTGLNMLNAWSAENAVSRLDSAREMLETMKDALQKMEDDQAKILETTEELARRDEMNDEVREELGRMDREQEAMKDIIEELAQDLYQFPDMPVCNELNSMMNEIFEDVEQAAGSENEPAIEIAVQKEDSFLDAIRRTKERVEDIEMWMPDVPDNIVWNMESFDTDEFPDMPLVPLPDELEDIVGELLDQAADIDAMSQDTTGNNMMADGEMGWDILDGPIPNFSAKGKSGNTRPNDNEMTGRSGAGREGQSSGELVEGVSKGLEGRETHARRTRDPFQSGVVEEDENSTLDAKATGGGKLGGVSETIGMFGNAPRRDQGGPEHGDAASSLRRETEALYTAARMLYLPTGSLGSAAREMKISENPPPEMSDFGSLHRTVVRRLEETRTELEDGVVLSMPSNTNETTSGEAVGDIDLDAIDEKYRGIVSDYYKDME
jgi:hypothetical protein